MSTQTIAEQINEDSLPSGLTLEEVKALYFDDDALMEPREPIYRIDGNGNRYYYKLSPTNKPTFFISVTSLIDATLPKGYGFHQWLKNGKAEETDYRRDSRAAYGTLMHIELAEYLIHGSYDLDQLDDLVTEYAIREGYGELKEEWKEELAKDILSFAAWVEKRNVDPIAVEVGLASEQMGIAGTVDIICELDWNGGRKRAIVDMKSGSFWPSHVVQLEAYKRLWEEEFPNKKIDMLFNWSSKDWRSEPTCSFKNQTDQPGRQKLDHLLAQWNIDNPTNKPKSVLTYKGTLKRGEDMSTNYKVEDIEDIIKKERELQWDA